MPSSMRPWRCVCVSVYVYVYVFYVGWVGKGGSSTQQRAVLRPIGKIKKKIATAPKSLIHPPIPPHNQHTHTHTPTGARGHALPEYGLSPGPVLARRGDQPAGPWPCLIFDFGHKRERGEICLRHPVPFNHPPTLIPASRHTLKKVMELLDAGSTGRYGHPKPTPVRTTPVAGKCIAVSGHDLRGAFRFGGCMCKVWETTQDLYVRMHPNPQTSPKNQRPGGDPEAHRGDGRERLQPRGAAAGARLPGPEGEISAPGGRCVFVLLLPFFLMCVIVVCALFFVVWLFRWMGCGGFDGSRIRGGATALSFHVQPSTKNTPTLSNKA